MKVGELKGLLDGLQVDTFIGIVFDEYYYEIGDIVVENGRLTKTDYLTLIIFNPYDHKRLLTVKDLKGALVKCPDNAFVVVDDDIPWQPNRFENGNFYVNG
jgi:hypothetical protein